MTKGFCNFSPFRTICIYFHDFPTFFPYLKTFSKFISGSLFTQRFLSDVFGSFRTCSFAVIFVLGDGKKSHSCCVWRIRWLISHNRIVSCQEVSNEQGCSSWLLHFRRSQSRSSGKNTIYLTDRQISSSRSIWINKAK